MAVMVVLLVCGPGGSAGTLSNAGEPVKARAGYRRRSARRCRPAAHTHTARRGMRHGGVSGAAFPCIPVAPCPGRTGTRPAYRRGRIGAAADSLPSPSRTLPERPLIVPWGVERRTWFPHAGDVAGRSQGPVSATWGRRGALPRVPFASCPGSIRAALLRRGRCRLAVLGRRNRHDCSVVFQFIARSSASK